MMRNRGLKNVKNLTNGPGKLTRAMGITGLMNEIPVYDERSELIVCEGKKVNLSEMAEDFRIGVAEDLDVPLRFYIKGNPFVSRASSQRVKR